MVKHTIVAGILSSALMAAGPYVGLDMGRVNVDYKAYSPSYNAKSSVDDTGVTFKGGYYFNQNNRVYGFYQYVDPNVESATFNQYGLGYDYLIGTSPLKPFVGAMIGRANSKVNNSYNKFDISGTLVGVQAGVNYSFNSNVSIEAGYRYIDYTNADAYESVDGVTVEATSAQNWFAGLNFKF